VNARAPSADAAAPAPAIVALIQFVPR
jgi:hypothetical protein